MNWDTECLERFDISRALTEMCKTLELETGVPFFELSQPDQTSYIRIFEAAVGALVYELGGPPRSAPQRDTGWVMRSELAKLEAEVARLRKRLVKIRKYAVEHDDHDGVSDHIMNLTDEWATRATLAGEVPR